MKHVAVSRRARTATTFVASGLALTMFGVLPASGAPDSEPEPTRTIHSDGNPIISDGSRYTADAATIVVDDTLYVYAGSDAAAPNYGGFDMSEYDILTTTDVDSGEWDLYEGALQPGEVFDWATGNAAYAGGVTEGDDGKFYWYTPVETKSTQYANRMAIGVAVSDSPLGPWEDALGEPVVDWGDVFGDSDIGEEVIDPHVLVDDRRVYLYWGSWYIARVVELEPDMITVKGDIIEMEGLPYFFEAPWVTKRGGEYHMLYDWKNAGSECTPSNYQACIGYATSDSPTGPWDFEGIVLGGTSSTTVHPSLIEFNDKWYMTYQTKDAKDGGHFRRSVAIDEVEWQDNRIHEVQPTIADDPAWRLKTNVAPEATASASYTETPPMRVDALNDGRVTTAMLPPDQWGNYKGETETAASDWVMYEWDQPVYVSSMGIEFHRDWGWIRQPADWELEFRDGDGEWQLIETDETPTDTETWHDVDFDPVSTDALRLRVFGTPVDDNFHAVSISEWEVNSAPIVEIEDVEVSAEVGYDVELPQALAVTYEDGTQGSVPVKWRSAPSTQVAGEFEVEGRALGFVENYVIAAVTVSEPEPVEPDPDPTDPVDPDPTDPVDPEPSEPTDPNEPGTPEDPEDPNAGGSSDSDDADGTTDTGVDSLPQTGPPFVTGAVAIGFVLVLAGTFLVVRRRALQ